MKDNDMKNTGGYLSCNGNCQFYDFFKKSRDAMFITSRDGVFIDVNQSLARLLDYKRSDLIGAKVATIYDVKKDRDLYIKYIEEKGMTQDYEITLKTAGGEEIFCLIDAIIWKVEGKIAGYYGIVRTKSQIIKSFEQYFIKLNEDRKQPGEDTDKKQVTDKMLLMRYGSAELVDYVQKTGKNPMASGKRKVTILFFDIIGSTTIAERLDPEVFTAFLSEIFIDIMDLIYGNHGSINKLLGDGLMATFGLPLETEHDSLNAVRAARQIEEYLDTYNDVKPKFLTQDLKAGMGIATGYVFAGVVGSVRWEEYTVLGDTVNIAARFEKLTRQIPGNILIDEATYREVRTEFPAQKIYKGTVRGRQEKMSLYAI